MNQADIRILRDNDPDCLLLQQAGYVLVGTSWGAHLDIDDSFSMNSLLARIEKVESQGYRLEMLGAGYAQAIFDLEVLNNPHYPYTPATHQVMPTLETTKALFKPNSWNFGAFFNDSLVGVCATSKRSNKTEIDFGSVHHEHRGKGLGIGIGAYAIKTLIDLEERHFATGGAEVNSASRATVQKLGFQIDEIWHSYSLPI
jgi:GNAT superfamily N-acetyltransferase